MRSVQFFHSDSAPQARSVHLCRDDISVDSLRLIQKMQGIRARQQQPSTTTFQHGRKAVIKINKPSPEAMQNNKAPIPINRATAALNYVRAIAAASKEEVANDQIKIVSDTKEEIRIAVFFGPKLGELPSAFYSRHLEALNKWTRMISTFVRFHAEVMGSNRVWYMGQGKKVTLTTNLDNEIHLILS